MIYLRHRGSIFCLFLAILAGGTVGDSEAARWKRDAHDLVRWAQEPFCTIPTRYGPEDDGPLAILNLPEVEAGTDLAASGVYRLLPKAVPSWLERLGVVAGGRFTCDFELHCTLHRQEIYYKKVPGKKKPVAYKQVPTRSVIWLDHSFSAPQAAVKFIPLFPKGSGIAFDVQADQKEGPRVASLPHGFLLRKFPQSSWNSEKTLLWCKVSLHGRKSDQPFFFAVLIFSPNRVIVHLELLPADNFNMDQDLANWESLLCQMLGRHFLECLDSIQPVSESVSIPGLNDQEESPSRPRGLSFDVVRLEREAETSSASEEEDVAPELPNSNRVGEGNLNPEDTISELLNPNRVGGESLDVAEILPRCFLAARKGHFLYLKKVFQRAAPEQWTAILKARAAKFVSKSEWIEGETLLHFAVQSGHVPMVKLLLERMPSHGINAKKVGRGTPLHAAAERGNAEIVELLLNRGASVNAVDYLSWTPLHHAIVEGHSEIVRLLLARGADPTIYERESALHYAVWKGNTEIVRLLLENLRKTGKLAHIQVPDTASRSPLYKAAEEGHAEVAKLLLEYGARVHEERSYTALHCASEKACYEIVEMLLDRGASINAVGGFYRETPLSVAARSGCADVVRLLLARHADVRIANKEGDTPLYHAAQRSTLGIVPMLLRQEGIDVDAKNGWQETPLHLAAKRLCVENVRALLAKGANPNAAGRWGKTPLHYVVWPDVGSSCVSMPAEDVGRALTILRLLLEKGADINALEDDRCTPLHAAVGRGNGESIRLLLKEGAAVDARNEQGKTPLHMAVEGDDPNWVYLLLEKGADGTAQTAQGFTPLHRVIYDRRYFSGKGACRIWIKTEIATAILRELQDRGMQGSDILALLIHDTLRLNNGGVTFGEWKAYVREDANTWYRNLLQEWGIDVDALLATPALSSPSTAMPQDGTPASVTP